VVQRPFKKATKNNNKGLHIINIDSNNNTTIKAPIQNTYKGIKVLKEKDSSTSADSGIMRMVAKAALIFTNTLGYVIDVMKDYENNFKNFLESGADATYVPNSITGNDLDLILFSYNKEKKLITCNWLTSRLSKLYINNIIKNAKTDEKIKINKENPHILTRIIYNQDIASDIMGRLCNIIENIVNEIDSSIEKNENNYDGEYIDMLIKICGNSIFNINNQSVNTDAISNLNNYCIGKFIMDTNSIFTKIFEISDDIYDQKFMKEQHNISTTTDAIEETYKAVPVGLGINRFYNRPVLAIANPSTNTK
jgi:hypothetical protein